MRFPNDSHAALGAFFSGGPGGDKDEVYANARHRQNGGEAEVEM